MKTGLFFHFQENRFYLCALRVKLYASFIEKLKRQEGKAKNE
jgi:hypothetical protein